MFLKLVPKPLFGIRPRTPKRLFSPTIRALYWVGALTHDLAVDSWQRSPSVAVFLPAACAAKRRA